MGRVQVGTKNRSAGWAWSKIHIAANVAHIPAIQPIKEVVKQGSLNYLTCLNLFAKFLSISNFKQSAINMPGTTISPKPNILCFSTPSALRQGNKILIGISNFLATVTITSVPQTQKISQKNRNHSKRNPTLKLAKSMFLNAMIENKIPKTLFNAQYLVKQYKITGIDTKTVQIMLATEISKSSISNIDLMNFGGLTCFITFLCYQGNGKLASRRLLDDMTVAMLNWIVRRIFTKFQLTYLQMRQKPSKKADATMGNLSASLWPIFYLLFYLSSSTKVLSLLCLSLVDMIVPRQTQQQLLISNCGKTGTKCKNPPMLASKISTDAIVLSLTKIAL